MIQKSPWAVVTGGSSGIGWEISKSLLSMGNRVLIVSRGRAAFEACFGQLEDHHASRLSFLAADVTDPEGLGTGLRSAISLNGAPEWLVTSAGLAVPGRFLDLSEEALNTQWAINYVGTLNTIRLCAPAMARAGRGRIVLISSAATFGTFYGYSGYTPSKQAVSALGDILRLELRGHGITVTTAFPPDTDTPQFRDEVRLRPAVAAALLNSNKVHPADEVAQDIVNAALRGDAAVVTGRWTKLFQRMPSLVNTVLRWRQQRLMARTAGDHAP